MGWREVFAFAQRRRAPVLRRGRIVGVDRTIHEAGVRSDDGRVENVAFDPRDALECVQDLVLHGGEEVCLECEHFKGVACAFYLMVDADAFDRAVQAGELAAEEDLITLATAVWRDARIPVRSCRDGDGAAVAVPGAWSEWHPPYAYQTESVGWMVRFESQLPKSISYDGNLKITDAWYVDTEAQTLTTDASPREAALIGGVCADGLGCGKTATALMLAQQPAAVAKTHLYESAGTLFLLPINLLSQWKREWAKFLPGTRALWISEAKDWKALTLQQLCDAQMVFTTFELLRSNAAYSSAVDEALQNRPRERAALSAWARRRGQTTPILEAVYWQRVVVDEIHQIFDSARDLKALRLFRHRVLWGLTGTPSLEGDAAQSLYLLLLRDKGHHPQLLAAVMRAAVRIGGPGPASELPGAQRRVELVTLTAEERVAERDASLLPLAEQVKRLTCGAEPEDAAQLRLNALKVQESAAERNLDILQRASAELELELQRCCDTGVLTDVAIATREACESQAKDVTKAKEVLGRLKRKREAWALRADDARARLRDLREKARCCQICGSEDVVLIGAACLHLSCSTCASAFDGFCPEAGCSQALVAIGAPEGGATSCTKLAKIGKYIRSLRPDEGVLLFVQFRSLLRQTRSFLKDIHIVVHTLDGNTRARAAALNALGGGGVLLLCLDDGFAGLHLPEVRHVVFAHAILGSIDRVRTLEKQAISRCLRAGQQRQVIVKSFICLETEEFEFYESTH